VHRRSLGALFGAILCFAALGGTASAATLVNEAGVLTYAAAAGKVNIVGFDEVSFNAATGAAQVDVYRSATAGDGDPLEVTGCSAAAGSDVGTIQHYQCAAVTRVVATAGDLDDVLDAGCCLPPDLGGSPADFGGANPALVNIPVGFDLGDGNDFGNGGGGNDTVRGGAGDDQMYLDQSGGGPIAGDDTGLGGPGSDFIAGTRGNDTIDGEAGDDFVSGGPGTDTVSGGAGDDGVAGGPGVDVVNGNGGDDLLEGDCGPFGATNCGTGAPLGSDQLNGGPGLDAVQFGNQDQQGPDVVATAVNVTLDDVLNDGRAGDPADNVHTDIEDVQVVNAAFFGVPVPPDAPEGAATVTGSSGVNTITTAGGNDTIDAGANNDAVSSGAGNDTVNARDGYADRITCGAGSDTANVDSIDVVSDTCETVNAVASGFATEDKSPTISWSAPASGAQLSTTSANALTVAVADDKGISQVLFLDDERVVCRDTAAPYTCDYKPQGDDVGRNTLVAVAVDTAQQTASAVRSVRVPRFVGARLSATTKPRSDTSDPRTFTTTGKLTLPTGVTRAQGCSGKVAVTFKAGRKTISTRRVNLTKTCSYRSKVKFEIPSRLAGKLQVVVRFAGNAVLAPKSAKRASVTT
jgi:Ca2+-binding RTX toxin-like protein